MKTNKFTKQGVRDLNHLKGKSTGVKLPEPPITISCMHRNHKTVYENGWYGEVCDDCGFVIHEGW